jgi:hypothetical protein
LIGVADSAVIEKTKADGQISRLLSCSKKACTRENTTINIRRIKTFVPDGLCGLRVSPSPCNYIASVLLHRSKCPILQLNRRTVDTLFFGTWNLLFTSIVENVGEHD